MNEQTSLYPANLQQAPPNDSGAIKNAFLCAQSARLHAWSSTHLHLISSPCSSVASSFHFFSFSTPKGSESNRASLFPTYISRNDSFNFFLFLNFSVWTLLTPECLYLSPLVVSHSAGRPCSRLTQGDVGQWEDPEAGTIRESKPASRHFYPIALLLVSSHLLVVWLILSLVFLLAKYQ